MTKIIRSFLPLLFLLSSCESVLEKIYNRGLSQVEAKNYLEGLEDFDKVLARAPESELATKAAHEASKISLFETKNFEKAIGYLKHLVLNSKDPSERLEAQRSIAKIYFEHLQNYPKAIQEMNRVLPLLIDPDEKEKIKSSLARSYYYQSNFSQALAECEELIQKSKNESLIFEMVVLKGNIFLAQKKLEEAAKLFKRLLIKYPERSVKENVALTLAVAYEEMKDYTQSIEVLETIKKHHPVPEYIDMRIRRLTERKKNLPGAKGSYRK